MKLTSITTIIARFIEKLKNEDFVTDKTGVTTIELIGESFLASKPAIFGAPNDVYIAREINWYMTKQNNINEMEAPIPKLWKSVANEKGEVNSNYGNLVFSNENYNQYNNIVYELEQNPDSRRAIMIYTRPTMHTDFQKNGMNDFICTNTVQYFIRNNALICVVNMRSNDAVFGYKNDYAWQKFIHIKLLIRLQEKFPELKLGDIIWQVGSLHVYERHFDLVKY